MLKKYEHNPAHLFLDDTLYFITAAIHEKRPLLAGHERKSMLRDTLAKVFQEYHWQLHHWVILDNHYHLLGQSRRGKRSVATHARRSFRACCRYPGRCAAEGTGLVELLGLLPPKSSRLHDSAELFTVQSGETWICDRPEGISVFEFSRGICAIRT